MDPSNLVHAEASQSLDITAAANAKSRITFLAGSSRMIPELDGLRGLAILPVVLLHAPLMVLGPAFKYGWIGVDLFFVLSGFLITRILLGTKDSPACYLNFYARRVLRIWPLYFAVLAVAYLVLPAIFVHARGTVTSFPASYYVLFVQNWFLPLMGSGLLGVTWSVAVEEQFYLVWPFMVRRFSPGYLRWLLLAVLVGSPVLRLAARAFGIDWHAVYIGTLFRADGIAAGALVALLVREGQDIYRFSRVALFSGIAGWVIALPFMAGDGMSSPLIFSANALLFAGALGVALTGSRDSAFRRVLRLRPLAFTGRISYGMYLLHGFALTVFGMRPVHRWLEPLDRGVLHDGVVLVVGLAMTYTVAWLSWIILESPLLRLKRHFEFSSQLRSSSKVPLPVEASGSPA